MKVPRLRFGSDGFAQAATCIFAETLQDMLDKYEDGSNPAFPKGFFHTSTVQHEGTCYYSQMWLRDCARGMIEMARLGFSEQALDVARYFLSHLSYGDHWGREIHGKRRDHELDGNALALLGMYNVWRSGGSSEAVGAELLNGFKPVLDWIEKISSESPYSGLMPSISELSGNPNTPYEVYPIWANYCLSTALAGISAMAEACGDRGSGDLIARIRSRLSAGLTALISDGIFSLTPAGCWINAIDGRNGRAYDFSDWDGSSWPIWHWTRQLPFICDSDAGDFGVSGDFAETHMKTYEFIRSYMNAGPHFRKYGFVSNSGWTGMADRHDETMCGYGQGFYTQAAMMADDVNTYTKCFEGIARLGYDGNVALPLSFDMNPWVMHECFSYDNYELGLDHTFGAHSNGRKWVMQNPGDEGNLVQEAEIIKAFALAVGADFKGDSLVLMPRLPWNWDSLEALDWPVIDGGGGRHLMHIEFAHERWLRKCNLKISGISGVKKIRARFGPFPHYIKNPGEHLIERSSNASWIWKEVSNEADSVTIEVSL